MSAIIKNKLRRGINYIMHAGELDTGERFLLELNESGQLSVFGKTDIRNYTKDNILLQSEIYYVDIYGTELYISEYSSENTMLTGDIRELKLLKRSK